MNSIEKLLNSNLLYGEIGTNNYSASYSSILSSPAA